jgi:hypothetical protein
MLSFLKYLFSFKKKTPSLPNIPFEDVTEMERHGIIYKIGDKVICKSNEPDEYFVGIIVEFWTNKGKFSNPTPIVKDLETMKDWMVMGIVIHYNEELTKILDDLLPIEQYNYLIKDYLWMDQLEEKYGMKYRTF